MLFSVYGEKLGTEAYDTVKNAREGASYRKNGGPLVRVVSKEKAAEIREKRLPEPYKGKGIHYLGEHIIRKEGKAGKGKK